MKPVFLTENEFKKEQGECVRTRDTEYKTSMITIPVSYCVRTVFPLSLPLILHYSDQSFCASPLDGSELLTLSNRSDLGCCK